MPPASANAPLTLVDGSMSFDGGVDSIKVTTIQSVINPNGLARNEVAWAINATIRDGGVTQRYCFSPFAALHPGTTPFQGAFMYQTPLGFPYVVYCIGGVTYMLDIANTNVPVQISDAATAMPAGLAHFYFCQAEEFLIIQAGDFVTLPLFWDGTTLRRSVGITNTAVAPGTHGVNEIPAAGPMDYYMGRLWYAIGRTYGAGDIVGGASGSVAYQKRDAVLNVTENPLVVGGDYFTVPSYAGNIRAICHSANIDKALGEGRLYVGTRKSIYALEVPVTRANWIAADSNNQPLQVVVQKTNGFVNDRSIVSVNGDLYYQSLEPGIRSLMVATRFFSTPGNRQISKNMDRVLRFSDRANMQSVSGIEFGNRLYQTVLPETIPQGVIHKAVAVMDFLPSSSLDATTSPKWEGIHEGYDVLQLVRGDFGGRERAFMFIVSRLNGQIWLYEITDYLRQEADEFIC